MISPHRLNPRAQTWWSLRSQIEHQDEQRQLQQRLDEAAVPRPAVAGGRGSSRARGRPTRSLEDHGVSDPAADVTARIEVVVHRHALAGVQDAQLIFILAPAAGLVSGGLWDLRPRSSTNRLA